jgi:RTX calcium-binding nonapeptide repeat (4 copies)
MANTIITTSVTGTQNLLANEGLILTASGTIANFNAVGISAADNNTLVINGTITSVFYSGIYMTGYSSYILVGATGLVESVWGTAVSVSATGQIYLKNYGTILDNYYSVSTVNPSGNDEVVNYGTISGTISLNSGANYLSNLGGTLNGSYYGGVDVDVVTNRAGSIFGDVYLSYGNDTFSNTNGGAVISGIVDLNFGDDQLILDTSSNSVLSVFGGFGFDSIDISSATSAIWLDLQYTQMEVWTSGTGVANGANANTMVANIDSFEKIIGTAGSDTILGDAKDNTYTYNGNFSGVADVFFGRGGVDTINLYGLSSIWVDLNNIANEVYTSGTNVAYGYNSNTVIANLDSVERIIGTAGSDQVFGDAADNTFVSRGVALNSTSTIPVAIELDRFDGRGGSDTIDVSTIFLGAIWADLTYVGPQLWVAYAQSFATGGNANLAIAQLTAVENVVGTVQSDQFYGDANANTYFFYGYDGLHTEIFDGRGGTDTFDGSLADYALWIGLNNPAMEVWTNGSKVTPATGANANSAVADLISVENITGSQYGDTLIGDGGNNRIEGGKGNDVLVGGLGADTFVFNFDAVNNVGVGIDQINDFVAGSAIGHDVIQISGYNLNYDTFAEVMINTTNTVSGVHIQFNDGSIDLLGLVKSQLTIDDFVFV